MTSDDRERLRQLVSEARQTVTCACGCGRTFRMTPRGRRYFERRCANRHWHVRRRLWA